MEKSPDGLMAQMKHIEGVQIVQGALERRIEEQIESLADRIDSLTNRIDSLAAAAEATNGAVNKLLQVAAGHGERLAASRTAWQPLRSAGPERKPLCTRYSNRWTA
jgi:prefoldin subunit 5